MNNQALLMNFEAEIAEVQSTLLVATTDLTNPLGDLVRAHIKRAQPPICGAVVLAVSTLLAPDDNDLRRKRVVLAAALEMLHIALSVHRLLVNAANREQKAGGEEPLDRTFIGSTILAGDYCFSRAAELAAHTDHPQVVATFALALQAVSEGLLREQFDPQGAIDAYDETRQLLESGALAAAQLAGHTPAQQRAAVAMSQQLAMQWDTYLPTRQRDNNHGDGQVHWQVLPSSPDHQSPGWQALYQWLNRQRVYGETPQN
jgi:octaprenyl-diphosphate synthase